MLLIFRVQPSESNLGLLSKDCQPCSIRVLYIAQPMFSFSSCALGTHYNNGSLAETGLFLFHCGIRYLHQSTELVDSLPGRSLNPVCIAIVFRLLQIRICGVPFPQ